MILMIYNNQMCREVLLPNLYNADHREIISAAMYGLKEDITLSMEVKPEGWVLKKARGYSVFSGGIECGEVMLADGDIVTVYTDARESVRIIVTGAAFSFLITEKFDLTCTSEITIGKNQTNAIRYDYRGLISGNHAVLMRRTDGWYIQDISMNGVFSERGRIRDSRRLEFAEHINIFGLHLVFLGDVLAVGTYYGSLYIRRELLQRIGDAPAITDAAAADEKFNRAPRNMPSLYEGHYEIEKPPARKEAEKKSWFMVVGPSLTMSIPMILGSIMMIWAMNQMLTSDSNQVAMMVIMSVGLVTSVGSAVIGAIWASQNLKFTRSEEAETEKKRFNAYSNYLIRATEELESKYSYNAETMHKMYPAAAVCAGFGRENSELWSRNQTHADFLQHRLGIGDVPFQMEIKIPEKHFTVDNDSLLEKPAQIKEQFSTLSRVPVCISLKDKQLIGLVGGEGRQGAVSVMQALIADIAASHCYTDVKFVFLYDEADGTAAEDWECMRWFPHVWSEDRQTRYMAANEVERRDILFALSNVMRSRVEGEDRRKQGGVPKPYYLLFVSDPAFLEGELMSRFIYSPRPEYGLTTFLMVESVEELPNTCEDVIEDDKNFQGYYNLLMGVRGRRPVQPDRVSAAMLEQMGRRLSGIRVQETEVTSEIPQSLDFFSMYGVRSLNEFNVEERWRKNRTYNSMKALIGRKGGDADCFLDVHEKYHGPHGLMAGTTGSGKSETLQTYILSLALNFSPEDAAFFIIDFKGGGMANLFSGLPHMAGQISNLSGNQVHRAMISIKSENVRRQQIFTEHGVNNINLYTRLYKEHEAREPIPHLFIIIDEFAELKKEEPDFMRELISVAQVGRSLGVHLILATQKPSGTVDDNIWSNSRFRICLRVQDQQDSKDMLHKPDAAFLTQTGRGYLQVGSDEIYELFQTGWSGAPYEEDTGVRDEPAVMLTRTGRESLATTRLRRLRKEQRANEKGLDAKSRIRDVTQLSAVVDYLAKKARELGFGQARQLWMPVLGDHILLAELPKAEETVKKAARGEAAGTAAATKGGLAGAAGAGRSGGAAAEAAGTAEAAGSITGGAAGAAGSIIGGAAGAAGSITGGAAAGAGGLTGGAATATAAAGGRASRHVFSLSTRVGLADDPQRQRQSALVLDFAAGGNMILCGAVSSGKSTFLQTMLYGLYSKYTPEQLQCYILDFSSHMLAPFALAPQTGGVVFENQADRLDKFMHFLIAMMDERREVLKGGSFAQYVQAHGQTMPAILLVIDNIGSLREKSDMRYDELLDRYVREGTGCGMYLAVSAGGFGINDMPVRIADNIKTAISLEQSDRYKYMDVLRRTGIAITPEQGVKGRGLADVDGRILEFQTALCFEAEDDYERGKLLESLYDSMSAAWTGVRPSPIPEIPENPTLSDLEANPDYAAMCEGGDCLPFAYNTATAAVFGAGLRETYCYTISGRAHTGKTNVLKLFMNGAKRMGGQLTVIEPGSTELAAPAQDLGARYVQTPAQMYAFFEELIPEFVRRNQKKQGLVRKGLDEYEIYRGMRDETPVFIFLSDLLAFFKVIYGETLPEFAPEADASVPAGSGAQEPEAVGDMSGFMENILEKGSLHRIYFFGCQRSDNVGELEGYRAYNFYAGYRKGVHLGGNLSAQSTFTFQNISYMDMDKTMRKGLAYAADEEDDTIGICIAVPLARREAPAEAEQVQ